MLPKTFVLVKCSKYEFNFMAAIYCYFMVQKKHLSTKALVLESLQFLENPCKVLLKSSGESRRSGSIATPKHSDWTYLIANKKALFKYSSCQIRFYQGSKYLQLLQA